MGAAVAAVLSDFFRKKKEAAPSNGVEVAGCYCVRFQEQNLKYC
jgi:hypothetical protein